MHFALGALTRRDLTSVLRFTSTSTPAGVGESAAKKLENKGLTNENMLAVNMLRMVPWQLGKDISLGAKNGDDSVMLGLTNTRGIFKRFAASYAAKAEVSATI
mmetsp:Transcript_758/g.1273  ORF Transcript_758/g.1273 Transcript_758/m.1273 type:complete len:103 (+) Transcript_758:1305-1613(+)